MNYKEISEICKKRRKEIGLTISGFAYKVPTSKYNIRILEIGNIGNMKLNTFLKILSALNLELKIVDKSLEE